MGSGIREDFQLSPEYQKFRSIIRLSLSQVTQKAGKPVKKLNFVKNIINGPIFREYKNIGLKWVFPINFNMYGIFPIDFSRTVSLDNIVEEAKSTYYIKPEMRSIVLSDAKKHLTDSQILYLEKIIENTLNKKGITLSLLNYFRTSIADSQIVDYILVKSKQPDKWIFNDDWIDTVPIYRYNEKIDSRISNESTTLGFETSKEETVSRKTEATRILHSIIQNLIKNKKGNIKSGKLWRYQIHALNNMKNHDDIHHAVFFIGKIYKEGSKYYFKDAIYTFTEEDKIQLEEFNGIEKLTSFNLLGLVGQPSLENATKKIYVKGILNLSF